METNKQVKDPYRSALKKRAMAFMPKNYEDVNAQKQILGMIVAVVPAAAPIMKAADSGLWPKVQAKSLPIIQAVGQCALEVNKAIAAAPLESLLLEKRSNEALLKAWVALDYYSYLMLPEYSANIRALRDRMFAILRQRDTGAAPAQARPAAPVQAKPPVAPAPVQPAPQPPPQPPVMQQPPVMPAAPAAPMGQAQDLNKTVMVERAAPAMDRAPQPAPAPVSEFGPSEAEEISATVNVAREDVSEIWEAPAKKKKSGSKAPIAIVAAVVIAVVAGMMAMNKKAIEKVQEAISAIGTVTLESVDEIETAEGLYEELSEGNREKVENRDTLFAARKEYDRQAKAVADVEAAIDAISTPVSLKSGDAVKKARKLYDALEKDLQDDVSNYSDLKTREAAYTKLYNEEQAGLLYTAAVGYFEAKDYTEAEKCIKELLEKYAGTSVDSDARTMGANCVAVLAQQALNENRLEDAKKLLDQAESAYKSTEETAALRDKLAVRLDSVRPANGKMFRITTAQGYCNMVITAEGSDICIKLISKEDTSKYALYYIREGQTFTMYLKEGQYIMHYAYGEHWYGEEAMFGEDGTYKNMNQNFELNVYYSGNWVNYEYYEFTLDVHDRSGDANITRDQF